MSIKITGREVSGRRERETVGNRKQVKLPVVTRDDVSQSGRDVVHKSRGLTSGLGICAFVAELLKINEVLTPGKKLTDEDLRKVIIGEFPHRLSKARSSVRRLYERKIGVWYYRALYNAGLLDGPKPKERSSPYDDDGKIILKTRGRRPSGSKTVGDLLEERKCRSQINYDTKPKGVS